MSKLYEFFEEKYNEDMVAQSFIIGNTLFDNIKEDLEKIISEFFFMRKINLQDNPDIIIIKPEKNNISKTAIKEMISELHYTSQFNNKKIYIIDQCEKLNDYSYNSILKLLEEPNPNIYAFLISTNMESISSTILSRCQQIFINSSIDNNDFDDNIKSLGDIFIDKIEKNKLQTIAKSNDLYIKISDRVQLRKVFEYILYKYEHELCDIINSDLQEDNKNRKIKNLSKKMIIVNDNINRLDYNLNKNISIDRFIVEMWRCNNENSRN